LRHVGYGIAGIVALGSGYLVYKHIDVFKKNIYHNRYMVQNLDANVVTKKLLQARLGEDIVFTFAEIVWIVENDPNSIGVIKSCEVYGLSTLSISKVSKIMSKLINLTTVKTDLIGSKISYPMSLRNLTIFVESKENTRVSKFPVDYYLHTLEVIHTGESTNTTQISVDHEDIRRVKILRVIAPIAKISLSYGKNYVLWNEYSNFEVFDVKDQDIDIRYDLRSDLKYLRCKDTRWEKLPSSSSYSLEHFEVGNINQAHAKAVLENSSSLKTFKIGCDVSPQMMTSLPNGLVNFAAKNVPIEYISYIPDSCKEIHVEKLVGTSLGNVKWPSSLKILTIEDSKINLDFFKSMPSTIDKLYLPNDNVLTDTHINLNILPSQIKLLVLSSNTNVTAASLGALIKRGCVVIANLTENEKSTEATKKRLKDNYNLYLREKL
jgi:hypothetical protein